MSIKNKISIINRVKMIGAMLETKYAHQPLALAELKKLNISLEQLTKYLNHLDALRPDYRTNDINSHMEAVNLHLDILRSELEKNDNVKLSKGINAIKTSLKFHPEKYSFLTFIIDWFIEWIYFV